MSIIIGIIIGACVMSLISTLALFTGLMDNQEIAGAACCGPVAIVLLGVCWVIGKVYKTLALYYVRTKLAAYKVYLRANDGHVYYADTFYFEKQLDDLLYKEEDNYSGGYVEKIKDCTNAKGLPLWGYVIGPNGFRKKGIYKKTVLSVIRPYSDLYHKISYQK